MTPPKIGAEMPTASDTQTPAIASTGSAPVASLAVGAGQTKFDPRTGTVLPSKYTITQEAGGPGKFITLTREDH